jgi:N6-L-threonylcarbamoyladenine synthase
VLLALETSCDETSAAIVHEGRVRSNIVSSQIQLHAEYGGVVPELATREHLKNLEPVLLAALREACIKPADLTAVAATQGPGLPAALMVGLKAAQAMAFSLGIPFAGINHHEAHLYSPWIWGSPLEAHFEALAPNISLIVSGGHTMLVHVQSELTHRVLGGTIDDAAGECFDKVAKLLGLAYPGGPLIDRLAADGDARRFTFPRPLLRDPNHDFSFSGLKTSVRYFLRDNPHLAEDPIGLRDLCASVQAAIVDVLVAKTIRAAEEMNVSCITASGGVTCNRALRAQLAAAAEKRRFTLHIATPSLSTDNAAMIAILAERKLMSGAAMSLDTDIAPGLSLV